jgi:hypothetical protein
MSQNMRSFIPRNYPVKVNVSRWKSGNEVAGVYAKYCWRSVAFGWKRQASLNADKKPA